MSARARVQPARTIRVDLGERSYPIRIGSDGLEGLGEAVARRTHATQVGVVTVPAIGRRYGGAVMRSLRAAGLRVRRIDVPDGDASKNLRQVQKLYDAFLDWGLDRKSVLVALGGGMLEASTALRGGELVLGDFHLAFMVLAAVCLISTVMFLRLPRNAGHQLQSAH